MTDVLINAEASVIKWAVALGSEFDMRYVELDARAELTDASLPEEDVIGVTQFSMVDDDRIYGVHFVIGVSTLVDENLFRLRRLSNEVFKRLTTGSQIPYYDAEAAVLRSQMITVPGTIVLPTHRVETRPFRFIQASALLDPAAAIVQ